MDKITIERETLERAIADYAAATGNDGALLTLIRTRTALFDLLRAELAAQPADAQQEPVAIVKSKYGDPERFGEREIRVLADLSKIPYDTKLYAAQPAPAAVPLDEWHEDDGDMLWWRFPIDEPPWCGTPTQSDWPGYHTHFTPFAVPSAPIAAAGDKP